jgi:hypothetical protein
MSFCGKKKAWDSLEVQRGIDVTSSFDLIPAMQNFKVCSTKPKHRFLIFEKNTEFNHTKIEKGTAKVQTKSSHRIKQSKRSDDACSGDVKSLFLLSESLKRVRDGEYIRKEL